MSIVPETHRVSEAFLLASCLSLLALASGANPAQAALLHAEALPRGADSPADAEQPVALLLSKDTFFAEDVHLDAIVWLDGDPGARPFGELWYAIMDEAGRALRNGPIYPVPGYKVRFSLEIPRELAGRKGTLQITWSEFYRDFGTARSEFNVLPESGVATSGRVPLAVTNVSGVPQRGVPVAVEVPFPRGALGDDAHVRLVDKAGRELPMLAKATAKWSRFGSVKRLKCAFAIDVDGEGAELFLEYGPEVRRAGDAEAAQQPAEGDPQEDRPLRVAVHPQWAADSAAAMEAPQKSAEGARHPAFAPDDARD